MTTGTLTHDVTGIGEVAGTVWRHLNENGPITLNRLTREVDEPRDLIMQAVGWLAREDKVTFCDGARSRELVLKY